MNCTIAGANLKILAKTVHSFAKIGDEIFLVCEENGIILRSVNTDKTAYATIQFLLSFFGHYNFNVTSSALHPDASIICKIPVKALLGVFKNPNQFEKEIEIGRIELDKDPVKLVFKFRYKNYINKTQSIWLLDGESLKVNYSLNGVPNIITSPASIYIQVISNFQNNDNDMTLDVTPDRIIMKNYVDGEVRALHHVKSQISLSPREFDFYKIANDTTITVALKPFRTAMHLAEYFNLGVTLNFISSGKPALVTFSNVLFECHFVLATVQGDEISTQSTIFTEETQSSRKKLSGTTTLTKASETILSQQDSEAINDINWDNDFVDEEIKTFVIPDSPERSESPQRKRMKEKFHRCFEPTFNSQDLGMDDVLVPDSDPES